MLGNRRRKPLRRKSPFISHQIESLESRFFLSAANEVIHPGMITRANTSAGNIQGDTPAQIRKAYGFDQISFGSGEPAADGQGQTIAIIDPYNDPTVESDLNIFDQQFGIAAPPSFVVQNQNGGSRLPQTNGSWAGEIATDVEWAHVIAPAANILLVEANTDNTSDLMQAVQYAIAQPSVSVMSISWGGGEFSGQTGYDPEFKTPAGHQGVTVSVAAGDNGAASGAQWPASAPEVLSVGGSVIALADQSGTYGSETSWTDTSGGYSRFEPEPAFQQVVQRSGSRSMPDVAYDADDNIGLALYDSVPYQGIVGWQTTDGTSDGAPQWAGLVAIADQGRALKGQGTLDGSGQTLPFLYSLYGAPGTSAYSSYTNYFNDITTPENPQATTGLPTVGYDTTTGLGSPKAAPLVNALINAPSSAALATVTQPLASQLSVTILNPPPAAVVGGAAGSLRIRLTNTSATTFAGSVSLTLDAATPSDLSSDPTPIATIPLANLVLHHKGMRTQKINFVYPIVTAGNYDLSATITTSVANTAPAQALSATTVNIAPGFVKLSPAFTGNSLIRVKPGKKGTARVVVRNLGNIAAVGTLSLNLFDSTDQTLDSSDPQLAFTPARAINLRSDKSTTIHLSFIAPSNLTSGSYFLIATINSSISGQTASAVIGTR